MTERLGPEQKKERLARLLPMVEELSVQIEQPLLRQMADKLERLQATLDEHTRVLERIERQLGPGA